MLRLCHRRIGLIIHIVVRHHEHGGDAHACVCGCLHTDQIHSATHIVHSLNLRLGLVCRRPPTLCPVWSCFTGAKVLVSVGVCAAILIRTIPVVVEELAFDSLIIIIIEKGLASFEARLSLLWLRATGYGTL